MNFTGIPLNAVREKYGLKPIIKEFKMGNINHYFNNYGAVEGDIVEFDHRSDPLYLFTEGKLIEISNQEFNILINKEKKSRGWELKCFRSKTFDYSEGATYE